MKLVLRELAFSVIIMILILILFNVYPLAINFGLALLALSSFVLMFATKSTRLNLVGMFLIAGTILSFIFYHGI